jgi:DNA-binding helix-hairpin-helix protein with protein kinase domain
MGAKTMTEVEAARASYALKDIETRQREAKARLRSEVMAAIRSGNTEDVDQWAQEYVKRGGRIEAFSRWYNDTVELATQVRADRELREAIEKSKDLRDLKRLGDAMTERQ